MYIQREYQCNNPNCGDGMLFVVMHSNQEDRALLCAYCGEESKETGRYWRIWKKNVIGYNKNGSKFEIYLRRDLQRKQK